jgi:aminoglycoside phosphotransferase (APT) family kinase protein
MMIAPPPDFSVIRRLVAASFPQGIGLDVARVPEGVSTFVYRITRGGERFYLRLLPEIGASFAPEVHAHAVLRARGAAVPEVIAYEHRHPAVGLSTMLTTEVPGEPLSRLADDGKRAAILFDAGRDLAIINSVPVAGFGWIARDSPVVTALGAASPTNRAFLLDNLDRDLAVLVERGLARDACATIERAVGRSTVLLDTHQGWLAHGDFDPTHIYGRGGRYTGIIDFGEMRGTDRAYDLGHFALRAWEADRPSDLGALLAGYSAVSPLPPDMGHRITLAAVLIGVRGAARRLRNRDAAMLAPDTVRALHRALARLDTPEDAGRSRER